MPCYHPMIGVDTGHRTESGKISYDIKSMPETLDPRIHKFVIYAPESVGMDSRWFVPSVSERGFKYIIIPCGKCIGCRLEYSRQWANRCMLELQYHDSAYFVTLTYDDYHIPISYYPDEETGEALESFTLCKRDFQLFMKRLRKRFSDQQIRFFACGEYGPSTFRPHYHVILFGLKLPDLIPTVMLRGNQYYSSASLDSCWSSACEVASLFPGARPVYSGKTKIGLTSITDVTWEACAYTARYITKKLTGPAAEFYSAFGLASPFVDMSRRPGIARQWYDDHPGFNDFDFIHVSTPTGGKKFRSPRYYHKLYDIDYPEESARFKEIRQRLAAVSVEAQLGKTDLNYFEYLQVQERNFKSKIKSLKREDF